MPTGSPASLGQAHHSGVGQSVDFADNILAWPQWDILQLLIGLCKEADARLGPGQLPCPEVPACSITQGRKRRATAVCLDPHTLCAR